MSRPDGLIEPLLRYHRRNPLRVVFGTPTLIALHGADQVQEAYEQLANQELLEPIHHRVVREGAPRTCYRITKKGMKEQG